MISPTSEVRGWRRHPLLLSTRALMLVVLAIAIGLASILFASELWAAVILMGTLGALSLALLGIVYRGGERRASWLGFALLGWGYMVLASGSWWDRGANRPELVTSILLERIQRYIPSERTPEALRGNFARLFAAPDPRDVLVRKTLDLPVDIPFIRETPLGDVLKYLQSATTGPKSAGIPIHVDPEGLKKARVSIASPITLRVEGVPLRTTLAVMLRQLGLTYVVQDGMLTITNETVGAGGADPFLRIGHCYGALLAAFLGSRAGRYFYRTRDDVTVGPTGPEAGA